MVRNSPIQVVCDAGPIIHLDELNCLDLLADFDSIWVPETVWDEVSRHRPEVLTRQTAKLTRVKLEPVEQMGFSALVRVFSLDAGEQEALALMRQQPEAILLTDDAAARLVAEQMGLRVHGTLGILVRAIRRGLRTPEQVIGLLNSLSRNSTLFIRPRLLGTIIARVRQEFALD